ncbi:unnamed protein product [Camellia sinensis]
MLDRSLVGRVIELGGKGMSFAAMSDWVNRWWKISGKVEVRPLGSRAFLFVLSSRREAEVLLRRRWIADGRDLQLEWWSPLALCTSKDTTFPVKSVWIRVMGVPIHLRGEDVYRVIGDRCGGYVEANESSVDLGYVRLRVRSSHGTPPRVVVRWGLWQFSLLVWVEEGPSMTPAVPEMVHGGGGGTDKDGTDLVQSLRRKWRKLGVNEYLQRFGPTNGDKGERGHLFELPNMGLIQDLNRGTQRSHLGFAKVQATRIEGLPKPKWANTRSGPSHGVRRDEGAHSVEAHANPTLSRVLSLLQAGLGSRPDDGSSPVVHDSMGIAEIVTTGPTPSSGDVDDAPSDLERVEQHTSSLKAGFGPSTVGASPVVRDLLGNAKMVPTGPLLSSVVVAVVPSVSKGVERHEHRLSTAGFSESQLQQPVYAEHRWSSMLDELAMVVRPEAGSDEVAVENNVNEVIGSDEVELESGIVGSDVDILTPEEVSAWVLSRINEVSQLQGVSFEGHEEEALRLFSALEESWRGEVPLQQGMDSCSHNDRNAGELRRLECTVNYDRSQGGGVHCTRRGRDQPLLLSCG